MLERCCISYGSTSSVVMGTTVTTNHFEARLSANRSDKKRNRMRIPHPWNWNRSQLAEIDRAFLLASRALAMQQSGLACGSETYTSIPQTCIDDMSPVII